MWWPMPGFPLYGYEFDPWKSYPDDIALGHVLKPGHVWPFLKSLSLTGLASRARDFLKVFELHKKTLRRLELMNIFLIGDPPRDDNWTPFLKALREMLGVHGCTVVIYGDMVDWIQEPGADVDSLDPVWWDMGVPWGKHVGRENLTEWFANGGECPVNQATGFLWNMGG
ncbi:hypothetical protein V8F20_004759 [Naviculisporaceae sp. PSN 640]